MAAKVSNNNRIGEAKSSVLPWTQLKYGSNLPAVTCVQNAAEKVEGGQQQQLNFKVFFLPKLPMLKKQLPTTTVKHPQPRLVQQL